MEVWLIILYYLLFIILKQLGESMTNIPLLQNAINSKYTIFCLFLF